MDRRVGKRGALQVETGGPHVRDELKRNIGSSKVSQMFCDELLSISEAESTKAHNLSR